MLNAKEARILTEEVAELLKDATPEQKMQVKFLLIGAKVASSTEMNETDQKAG